MEGSHQAIVTRFLTSLRRLTKRTHHLRERLLHLRLLGRALEALERILAVGRESGRLETMEAHLPGEITPGEVTLGAATLAVGI